MTIIEAVKKVETYKSPFEIMDKNCPSDYDFPNLKGCPFRSKGSIPDDMQCLKCWTRKYKEKADD